MKRFIFRFCLFFFLFPSFSLAFPPPGDRDYLILKTDQYHLIFDKQYLDSIDKINKTIKNHILAMSQFQKRNLEEPLNIILLSSKTQISNAMASFIPFFTIIMFPTAVGIRDALALNSSSWFDSIFEHELNHIFQMSHSKYPKYLRSAMKLFVILPSPFLFSSYPNIFTPRFITEGDSILKESILGYGGRLYNGNARAFVFSQIKHYHHQIDQFAKYNLIEFTDTPHTGREKYLHGGYMMAMLAEQYPSATVNQFFKIKKPLPRSIRKQIKHTSFNGKLFPFFESAFSFNQTRTFIKNLAHSYFNHYLDKATLQKTSPKVPLFKSSVCLPFNKSENHIFFLTSDLKSTPFLRVMNRKNKKIKSKQIDLPLGKVFKINSQYYSRSSKVIHPYTTHYSLFSKGYISNNLFDSKYVEDLKDNQIVYTDTKNNVNGFKLYLNDKFFSYTDSNAILDQDGNIYYFKQKKSRRILYKNKSPLVSYKGYYGSLLDIDKNGAVYFTGSSPYGSSIYRYKNGSISRSSSSDTIIQAQKLNNKEFIVCEINPHEYAYKIIPIEYINEKPVLYKYKFKNRFQLKSHPNQIKSKPASKPASPTIKKKAVLEEKIKYYKPILNMGFSSGITEIGITEIFSTVRSITFKFNSTLIFSDYLAQNLIFVTNRFPYILFSKKHIPQWTSAITYINRKHKLKWFFSYIYNYNYFQTSLFSNSHLDYRLTTLRKNYVGMMGLHYPFIRRGRWFSFMNFIQALNYQTNSISEENPYSKQSFKNILLPEKKIDPSLLDVIWYSDIYFGYVQKFPQNYSPHRAFIFHVSTDHNKNLRAKFPTQKEISSKVGLFFNSVLHLGEDFYMYPELYYITSFNPARNPVILSVHSLENKHSFLSSSDYFNSTIQPSHFSNKNNIVPLSPQSTYIGKNLTVASLGYKKVFHIAHRSRTFIPLFQSRWMILEPYSILDYLLNLSPSGTELFKKSLDENTASPQFVTIGNFFGGSKIMYLWEWTVGFEFVLQLDIDNTFPITIGFIYGRTIELKKKKDDKENKKNFFTNGHISSNSILSSTAQRKNSPQLKTNLVDSSFHFYLKYNF